MGTDINKSAIGIKATRLVLQLLLALLSVNQKSIAQDFWQPTAGPVGGSIYSFAINASGHIFASTYRNGVFRSTDNGNSWMPTNKNLENTTVSCIVINSSGHLLAGTEGRGVFRSTDNGTSWAAINNGLASLKIRTLILKANGHIFTGTEDAGVFRSTDNGANWLEINSGLTDKRVHPIAINSNGDIFAGTDGGSVFRSTDNGNSWSPVNNGLTGKAIVCLGINSSGHIFAGTYEGGAFRSTDNGQSWMQVSNGLSAYVFAITIAANGNIFVGTAEGIFLSNNNGASWMPLNTGLPSFPIIEALLINSTGSIFVGIQGAGIFRSTNNGGNWAEANNGLACAQINAVAINANGKIFTSVHRNGIFRSTNNGDNWIRINSGLTNLGVGPIAINASNGNIFAGTGDGIFLSVDEGATWTQLSKDIRANLIAINPTTQHIFAGVYGTALYRSTDNGKSWTPLLNGLPDKLLLRALVINSQGHIFVGTLFQGSLFRSTDNGDTWKPITAGLGDGNVMALAINRHGHIFAGTQFGVFRSMNNGENWGRAPNDGLGDIPTVSLAVNPIGHIFAGTSNGVFRSKNNGTVWEKINVGLNNEVRFFATNSEGYLFAGTDGGGVFRSAKPTIEFFTEIAASARVADLSDGRGVAFGDTDNDGDIDIYVSNETPVPSNHLFINNGSGQFDLATDQVVIGTSNGQGIAFGDIDRDGDLDLFVASFGGSNKLYLNEGNNKFNNIAAIAGVGHQGQGRGVAFGDIDNDGDLDLYVVYQEQRNRMYRNNGNKTFKDIASIPKYGLADSASFIDTAASFGDVDNDGDLDLYVSGGVGANLLFRNNGDTTFTEIGKSAGVANELSGQGIAFGDIDNDQDLDLYVANGADHKDRLYENKWNEGRLRFEDISSERGVDDSGFGTGVAFADIENDGDLDLFLVNTAGQQNHIFLNNGRGFFTKGDTAAGIGGATHGRGTAFGDIDNDGDLDLYVVISDGPDLLYRNEINTLNNFLTIKTIGRISNLDGIGARVRVVTGGLSQIREVNGGSGYLSQNSLPVEFGLGLAPVVDSVIVRWPSGVTQILTNVQVNQVLPIIEPGVNRSPIIANTISNQQLKIGDAPFMRDLNMPPIVFSDPDGDALTYSANSNASEIATASVSGSQLTITPIAVGSATITVSANDGRGGTVSTTFNVTVSGLAPTVTTNLATNVASTSATLNGRVNPNGLSTTVKFQYGPTISYGFEITATQSPVSGTIEVSVSAQLTNLSPNTQYNYRVIGMNSIGNTTGTNQTFTTSNRPPVVANTISNQTLTVGGPSFTRDLNAVFSDPDGDALSYTATSSLINNATANVSGSTLTVSPVSGGVSTITVTANDGKGGMISTTFQVTTNRPPALANPIANQALTAGGASFTRDLNISPAVFSDPDGDALAFSANSSATNIATARTLGTVLTVAPVALGNATITVTANDGRGGMISTNFTVTINLPAYPSSLSLSKTVTYPSRSSASNYPATDYRIVGLPGASNRLANEFLSGVQNKDWQAYRDNGAASNFFIVFDGSVNFQFSVGRAFWVITKTAFRANITSSPSAPLNASQEIEVPLQNGWNIITNPFTTSVLWSKIQTANNIGSEPIWAFNGSFSPADTFKTYAGYYFFNVTNLTLLKIPYSLYFTSNSAEAVSTNWRVQISLSAGQFNEQAASFGVSNEASHELDAFDFRKPRALAATPTAEFKRPQWDANYSTFATDIRPEFKDSENWDFDVRTTQREASQLTFSGISKIPSHFEVYLIDEGRAQTVNLREDSLYRFTPATELSKFSVVVGKKEAVQDKLSSVALPKTFALGPNYPNPFNPSTNIPVAVPVASEIKLKIYNLLGAEVKTIYDGTIEAGRYWFNWDGKTETGTSVATGVYLYRLSTSMGVTLLGKMILIR